MLSSDALTNPFAKKRAVYLHNQYRVLLLQIPFEDQDRLSKTQGFYQHFLHLKNNLFVQMKYFELK